MKIAIFGTTGAGKTSISKELSKRLNYEIFLEPIDKNPYFDSYFSDMKNTMFKMQVYFLTSRSIQLFNSKQDNNVIFDRTIYEDTIFMKLNHELGNVTDTDFKTYNDFYKYVILENLKAAKSLLNFDLVIYVKVSTDKAVERIKKRARKQEQIVEYSYWDKLNKSYEQFYLENKNNFPFYIINGNNDDLNFKINEILDQINKLKK